MKDIALFYAMLFTRTIAAYAHTYDLTHTDSRQCTAVFATCVKRQQQLHEKGQVLRVNWNTANIAKARPTKERERETEDEECDESIRMRERGSMGGTQIIIKELNDIEIQ